MESRSAALGDSAPLLRRLRSKGSITSAARCSPISSSTSRRPSRLKQKMLACHESQRNWLRKQHGIDEYMERCERWSAARGREIGVQYGEAFRQHTGHPYPGDNRLAELLKDRRADRDRWARDQKRRSPSQRIVRTEAKCDQVRLAATSYSVLTNFNRTAVNQSRCMAFANSEGQAAIDKSIRLLLSIQSFAEKMGRAEPFLGSLGLLSGLCDSAREYFQKTQKRAWLARAWSGMPRSSTGGLV